MQAQTDYSRSRYDYMMNVIKLLQQAAGTLSQQSLEKINSLLQDSPPPAADSAQEPSAKVQ